MGVEESMDYGEQILIQTNGGVPTLTSATTRDTSTTTETRKEEERGRRKQDIRSGGMVEDLIQSVEEVRTATPSSSPKRTKEKRE